MLVQVLFTAVIAGITSATVWLVLGGSILGAIGMYALSGNLMIFAIMLHAALRKTPDNSPEA